MLIERQANKTTFINAHHLDLDQPSDVKTVIRLPLQHFTLIISGCFSVIFKALRSVCVCVCLCLSMVVHLSVADHNPGV